MKNKFYVIKTELKNKFNLVFLFINNTKGHNISAHAAQSTLFIFISLFPFVMLFLSLLNYIPLPLTETGRLTPGLLPEPITDFVSSILNEIHQSSSITLISVTAVAALWTASKGFYAIGKGLNSVYEVKETRNYFILRFFSLLETIVFIIVLIVVLIIMVFGNILHDWLDGISPVLAKVSDTIISVRGIGGITLLSIFFTSIYVVIPDKKSKIKNQIPGGICTAIGWVVFSYLYAFYINHFSNYSNIYGSLTAIVLLLLWLYCCMYMLFLGGEINCLLTKGFHRTAPKA